MLILTKSLSIGPSESFKYYKKTINFVVGILEWDFNTEFILQYKIGRLNSDNKRENTSRE